MPRPIESTGNSAPAGWRGKMLEGLRPEEDRSEPRYRTRLRAGTITSLQRRFITNCLICDRSPRGARLRLPADVSVPNEIMFQDDEAEVLIRGKVRWRKGQEIGLYIPVSM